MFITNGCQICSSCCFSLCTVPASTHPVLHRQDLISMRQLMDPLTDSISQCDFVTLRDSLAINPQVAQQLSHFSLRQLGIFVTPLQQPVHGLCQLTDKEVLGVSLVAEKEGGFYGHALRVEEPSPGSLPSLPQGPLPYRLTQLRAVRDRREPGVRLIAHSRNECAAVNFCAAHSRVVDHAVAQQPRLEV